jgi:hypothetical protein
MWRTRCQSYLELVRRAYWVPTTVQVCSTPSTVECWVVAPVLDARYKYAYSVCTVLLRVWQKSNSWWPWGSDVRDPKCRDAYPGHRGSTLNRFRFFCTTQSMYLPLILLPIYVVLGTYKVILGRLPAHPQTSVLYSMCCYSSVKRCVVRTVRNGVQ